MEIVRTGHKTEAFFDRKGKDPRTQKRLYEMNEPWRRAQTEMGEALNSSIPSAAFRGRDGRTEILPVNDPEAIAKKARARGMVERPSYGGAPLPDGIVYRTLSCGCRVRIERHAVGKYAECPRCDAVAMVPAL